MFKFGVIAAYVAALIVATVFANRKTKTLEDFFLGARGIGPWMSAMAYGTAYFSAVIFIGFAGSIGWGFGLSGVWIGIFNAAVGTLLAWIVLAGRTRTMTGVLGVRTMPELLEARYDSRGLKIFSALVIFVFLIPYSASVFRGLSYLFQEVFEIPYWFALGVMTLLTILYLIFGGYFAVNFTSMIQGLIMVVGVILMLFFVLRAEKVQGFGTAMNNLAALNPKLTAPVGPPGIIPLLSLVILTSLGTWGLPQMVQKFYAIKRVEMIRTATIISTLFAVLIGCGAYFMGSLTRLFHDAVPAGNPDRLVPGMIQQAMPDWMAGLVCAMILSASMSTLASLVIVSSSVISMDLAGNLFPKWSEKNSLLVMRLCCALFVLASVGIALGQFSMIVALMSFSWGTVAGAFLAPYLYGLFWKGGTKMGAWAAALSGVAISLLLSAHYKFDGKQAPFVGSVAMVAPLIVFPLVSLITPRLSPSTVERAFAKEQTR